MPWLAPGTGLHTEKPMVVKRGTPPGVAMAGGTFRPFGAAHLLPWPTKSESRVTCTLVAKLGRLRRAVFGPGAAVSMATVAATTQGVAGEPMDPSLPPDIRRTAGEVVASVEQAIPVHTAVLLAARTRLQANLTALEEDEDANLRPVRDIRRKLKDIDAALARLQSGAVLQEHHTRLQPFLERWRVLERMNRMQRQMEVESAIRAETRFLPTAPCASSLATGGTSAAAAAAAPTAPSATSVPLPRAQGFGSLGVMATVGQTHGHSTVISQEIRYAFGKRKRPVELVRFDTCSQCQTALQHNTEMQALVCPKCGHWKRFADMTASAMPYGDDMDFNKFTYKPVSHLEDIMKCAQGAEPYVVPPQDLLRVMKALAKRHVRSEDLTLTLIRQVCSELKDIKADHAVQIHSRLSGRAPRRMTAFQMDQMRIMFHSQEPVFRKYCKNRSNNLSFPYTLYKYCELLGYWEMLESFPLLRGMPNLGKHDAVLANVCNDLDWQFIPTTNGVGLAAATAVALGSYRPACKRPQSLSQQCAVPAANADADADADGDGDGDGDGDDNDD